MGGWQCKTMLISRWLKKGTFRGDKRQSWPDVAYWPSTQLVEKKQMLRVSSGFSCVNSGERVWGSDSPVREELSTFTGRRERREQRYPEKPRERVTGWDWQGGNERRSTYQQQVQWCNTCHVKSTFCFGLMSITAVKLNGWHFEKWCVNRKKGQIEQNIEISEENK